MRRALIAVVLAGCHVVNQVDETHPTPAKTVHHLQTPTGKRRAILVGDRGTLRFVQLLTCPTEIVAGTQTTTVISHDPNLATFVVGVIATSVGAIALAKGAFDKNAALWIPGAAGLAVGATLAVGPWIGDTKELRAGAEGPSVTTATGSEACGVEPLVGKRATISVHGLSLDGELDAQGNFSVSPFSITDAYQVQSLHDWDAVATVDGGEGFTQVIPGNDIAVHAFEFLQGLDVDTAIKPMHLVPGVVAGTLRVSLTSDARGPLIRIVLPLTNDGPGDATALRGQIAAPQSAWLDGRMIYIGGLPKGSTSTRELLVPIPEAVAAALRDDPIDLSIELRDGHGTAPTTPVRFRGVVMADAPR